MFFPERLSRRARLGGGAAVARQAHRGYRPLARKRMAVGTGCACLRVGNQSHVVYRGTVAHAGYSRLGDRQRAAFQNAVRRAACFCSAVGGAGPHDFQIIPSTKKPPLRTVFSGDGDLPNGASPNVFVSRAMRCAVR